MREGKDVFCTPTISLYPPSYLTDYVHPYSRPRNDERSSCLDDVHYHLTRPNHTNTSAWKNQIIHKTPVAERNMYIKPRRRRYVNWTARKAHHNILKRQSTQIDNSVAIRGSGMVGGVGHNAAQKSYNYKTNRKSVSAHDPIINTDNSRSFEVGVGEKNKYSVNVETDRHSISSGTLVHNNIVPVGATTIGSPSTVIPPIPKERTPCVPNIADTNETASLKKLPIIYPILIPDKGLIPKTEIARADEENQVGERQEEVAGEDSPQHTSSEQCKNKDNGSEGFYKDSTPNDTNTKNLGNPAKDSTPNDTNNENLLNPGRPSASNTDSEENRSRESSVSVLSPAQSESSHLSESEERVPGLPVTLTRETMSLTMAPKSSSHGSAERTRPLGHSTSDRFSSAKISEKGNDTNVHNSVFQKTVTIRRNRNPTVDHQQNVITETLTSASDKELPTIISPEDLEKQMKNHFFQSLLHCFRGMPPFSAGAAVSDEMSDSDDTDPSCERYTSSLYESSDTFNNSEETNQILYSCMAEKTLDNITAHDADMCSSITQTDDEYRTLGEHLLNEEAEWGEIIAESDNSGSITGLNVKLTTADLHFPYRMRHMTDHLQKTPKCKINTNQYDNPTFPSRPPRSIDNIKIINRQAIRPDSIQNGKTEQNQYIDKHNCEIDIERTCSVLYTDRKALSEMKSIATQTVDESITDKTSKTTNNVRRLRAFSCYRRRHRTSYQAFTRRQQRKSYLWFIRLLESFSIVRYLRSEQTSQEIPIEHGDDICNNCMEVVRKFSEVSEMVKGTYLSSLLQFMTNSGLGANNMDLVEKYKADAARRQAEDENISLFQKQKCEKSHNQKYETKNAFNGTNLTSVIQKNAKSLLAIRPVADDSLFYSK